MQDFRDFSSYVFNKVITLRIAYEEVLQTNLLGGFVLLSNTYHSNKKMHEQKRQKLHSPIALELLYCDLKKI